MAEPFIGEIRIFAGNFAPRNWAFCDGDLLPISQNTALYAILGTKFGGDGRTSFRLPDLKGRAPMHFGTGPGLTPRAIGQFSGSETQTLSFSQMPAHNHSLVGTTEEATETTPSNTLLPGADFVVYGGNSNLVNMDSRALGVMGGGQAHNNVQPVLAMNFIIAKIGLFPSRS